MIACIAVGGDAAGRGWDDASNGKPDSDAIATAVVRSLRGMGIEDGLHVNRLQPSAGVEIGA